MSPPKDYAEGLLFMHQVLIQNKRLARHISEIESATKAHDETLKRLQIELQSAQARVEILEKDKQGLETSVSHLSKSLHRLDKSFVSTAERLDRLHSTYSATALANTTALCDLRSELEQISSRERIEQLPAPSVQHATEVRSHEVSEVTAQERGVTPARVETLPKARAPVSQLKRKRAESFKVEDMIFAQPTQVQDTASAIGMPPSVPARQPSPRRPKVIIAKVKAQTPKTNVGRSSRIKEKLPVGER